MTRKEVTPLDGRRNQAARFVPVMADSMEPTLYRGDMIAVLPVQAFEGAGIYAIEVRGAVHIWRVDINRKGLFELLWDNPVYKGSEETIGKRAFRSQVLGKAFAVCKVTDRRLMEMAGMVNGLYQALSHELGGRAAA